jgi:hypothetical protein
MREAVLRRIGVCTSLAICFLSNFRGDLRWTISNARAVARQFPQMLRSAECAERPCPLNKSSNHQIPPPTLHRLHSLRSLRHGSQ